MVSVSIHLSGEDGLLVERLVWACVVWSMLQIYYLARGRQVVTAYALSMLSVVNHLLYLNNHLIVDSCLASQCLKGPLNLA